MGFFTDLFGTSDDYQKAADQRVAGLTTGLGQATPLIQEGRADINTGYTQAQDVFKPIVAETGRGADLYADLTGANGPEGQARAKAAFQTDPGYDFTKGEALQATERTAGTGGGQLSGGLLTALQDRAAGLASTQYGNWAARLAPYTGQNIAAGGALGSLYTGQGTDLASSLQSEANLKYGTATGIGNAQAASTLAEANAENQFVGKFIDLGGKLLGFALGGPAGGALAGAAGSAASSAVNPFFGGGSPSGYGA